MIRFQVFLLSISLIILGCSLQKIALKTTSGLFNYSLDAIYEETDLDLAEKAIASNLKLLEGFHKADEKNKSILLLLTQGYASYSLGFVEDVDEERAKIFYLRARDYGLLLLQQFKVFKDSLPVKEVNFNQKLGFIEKQDVPQLFWTAFAWAGWINLSRDDPQAIFDLGKVKAMMNRVLELDEGFFFGSAHLFFGSIYGSLPKMLGGDPEKAKKHFDRSLELSKNKFQLSYIYLARYYAQPILDEDLFDEYLQNVENASYDILPGYELITAIAKDKAQKLSDKREDLF
jgi:hypothetical protein